MVKKYNIKKIIRNLMIIISLLPFVQTSYHIFVPSINKITLIWKIVIIGFSTLTTICYYKKIDKLLVAVILCNAYMIIPTFIHNGYIVKFFRILY